MSLALGIDIGTSGVRTAVLDVDGTLLAMARAAHPNQSDPESIDAQLWWKAVSTCLAAQVDTLRSKGHAPADISRIAVDGTSGSMVLTDRALTPVSPALMYNSKGFTTEASRVAEVAPQNHITQGSNSALARAMRLAANAWDTPAHLLHQADYIAAKLLGSGGQSDFNNALKTGFDPEDENWPGWVDKLIDPNLLPSVGAPGRVLGTIDPAMAQEFGLSSKTVIHAGTTDSIAAFLAAAPLEPGVAVTSLGSTLAVKMLCNARIDDPSIGLYSHRLGDFWLAGGASNTGGAVLAHYFKPDEIDSLSTRINPGSPTGLGYYPLLTTGERFPINDPSLSPKMEPRPSEDHTFLQAIFEGIADIEARCYACIATKGGGFPKLIYSAGGGATNATFTEIRAQHLGITPKPAPNGEAAVGTAKLALST